MSWSACLVSRTRRVPSLGHRSPVSNVCSQLGQYRSPEEDLSSPTDIPADNRNTGKAGSDYNFTAHYPTRLRWPRFARSVAQGGSRSATRFTLLELAGQRDAAAIGRQPPADRMLGRFLAVGRVPEHATDGTSHACDRRDHADPAE